MALLKRSKSTKKRPNDGFIARTISRIKKLLLIIIGVIFVLPVIYIFLLKFINPPISPLMVQRLFQGYGYERQWVDLKKISPNLRYAVIAAEDNKFCLHSGFDYKALRSVIADSIKGKRTAGASTISMQTSKNLLLLPNRSFVRKILEAYYTVWLEIFLDKKRIMEIYLNIIELGQGVYGAQAGAQYYYKTSAAKLSRQQASQLATILPSPLRWQPSASSKSRRYEKRITRLGSLLNCVK